jgi:hypothetical protein
MYNKQQFINNLKHNNYMRKITLFLFLAFASIFATKAQIWLSNQCNIELSGSVLRVYPTNGVSGAMQDFMLSSEEGYNNPVYSPWFRYVCHIKKVVIEDGVTLISIGAFAGLALDSIIIGKDVMNIGYRAFYNLRPVGCMPYSRPIHVCFKSSVPPSVIPHPTTGSTEVFYAHNSAGVDQIESVTVPYGSLSAYLDSEWSSQSYSVDKIGEGVSAASLERMYDYDASGNRTCRKVLMLSKKMSSQVSDNEMSMDASELKNSEEEVVYSERIGNLQLRISPNPTTDKVTVRIDNYSDFTGGNMRLYSTGGQLLEQYQIDSPVFTIDLSNYVQGVYLLKWQMNQHTDTWKIIKQ